MSVVGCKLSCSYQDLLKNMKMNLSDEEQEMIIRRYFTVSETDDRSRLFGPIIILNSPGSQT